MHTTRRQPAGTHATRTALVAVGAGALMCLTPSSHAQDLGASGGVDYRRSVASLAAAEPGKTATAAVAASCAAGSTAVGGGWTVADSVPGRGIHGSAPQGSGGWLVEAWSTSQLATSISSFAVCVKDATRSVVTTTQAGFEDYTEPMATLMCPQGHAVAAGVRTDAGMAWLNQAFPVDSPNDADDVADDGWSVGISYHGQTGGGSASFRAICLTGPRPAYRSSKVVTVPFTASGAALVVCPEGRPVLGGGARLDKVSYRASVTQSRPWDGPDADSTPDDGWKVRVRNDHHDEPTDVTAYAVCR